MELLDLHCFLLSWIVAGQRGDERVHHRRKWRCAFAKPDVLAFRVGRYAGGGCGLEYHRFEYRQMAAECGRRVHVLAVAGAFGHRGDFVGGARLRNAVYASQHVAGLELGYRELLVANCVCVQWSGTRFSDEPGSAQSAKNAAAGGVRIGSAHAVMYIVATVAVLALVPAAEVSTTSGVFHAITVGSIALKIGVLGIIAAVVVTVGNAGGVGSTVAGIARVPFVVGIDRYLPAAFGKIHPRWKTPYVSIMVQAVVSCVILLISQINETTRGAYQFLVDATIILYFIH